MTHAAYLIYRLDEASFKDQMKDLGTKSAKKIRGKFDPLVQKAKNLKNRFIKKSNQEDEEHDC